MKNTFVSPLVQLAALIIIVAGLMAMQSILLPIIMALFISIICMQPIIWITKKRIPYFLAVTIVLLSMALLFLSFGGIIGNSLAKFTRDLPKYESNLKEMTLSFITYMNARGAQINPDQLLKMIDPGKILSFTTGVVGEIGGIMSDSLIIYSLPYLCCSKAKALPSRPGL